MDSTKLIQEAAILKQMGRGQSALETLQEAVAALESERRLKFDAAPRLHLHLVKRRTRFFIKYAKRHTVRLSALLFLVAVHTRQNWRRGYRGQKAGWHQNARWFGDQIGVSRKQIFRLLEQASKLYLLSYTRTGRGLIVWVEEPAIFKELKKGQTGWGDDHEYVIGYYYLRLAKVLGTNASIIYSFLRQPEHGEDGEFIRFRRVVAEDVAFSLPWIDRTSARKELEKLEHFGVIQRHKQWPAYAYFWKKRNLEDHKKWLRALIGQK